MKEADCRQRLMRRETPREYESGWVSGIPFYRGFEIAERAERFEGRLTYDTALEIPLCFFNTGLDAEAAVAQIEHPCDEGERPDIAMNMFAPGPRLAEIKREPCPVAAEGVGPPYHAHTSDAERQTVLSRFTAPSSD
ncbi:hypothetical protein [Roseivivax isoporae]|uniref:hypothetical protein n=1 Tax=Roseivivax isoporae TaxID=591206 RepID=UPI0012EC2E56|nr:hypothetical protein [Roseivivax isoporae]